MCAVAISGGQKAAQDEAFQVASGNGHAQSSAVLRAVAFSARNEGGDLADGREALQKLSEAELKAAVEAAEAALREADARRETAEIRLRVAEAVAELLAIASSANQLEDALEDMVDCIHAALGVEATALYRAADGWNHPVLIAASGQLPGATRRKKYPIPAAILARALAGARGVAVENGLWQESVLQDKPHGSDRRPGEPALLVTPIRHKDALYGYLIQFDARRREFTENDAELAHLFGRQLTLALDNAELRSNAERVAVENERSRLARDLHDAVTQTLFSASIVAEALPRVWDRDPEEGKRALEDLRLWTRGALAEMRTLLMELRPAALIDKPMPDLIRQLGEAAATRLLIAVDCDIMAEAEPTSEVKLALYRIAQEALNNMVKHSNASHVAIRYLARPEGIELAIADDGRGFEPGSASPGQLGLGIMQERARQIGATLVIRSGAGAGTEVRAEWRPRRKKNMYE
jgi:signal transduction histidine kinase